MSFIYLTDSPIRINLLKEAYNNRMGLIYHERTIQKNTILHTRFSYEKEMENVLRCDWIYHFTFSILLYGTLFRLCDSTGSGNQSNSKPIILPCFHRNSIFTAYRYFSNFFSCEIFFAT